MIDKRQQDIKERISRHAMDLWGISDPNQMDPVIDLLLDTFAYNSNRLYQDMEAADAAILHQLARILVPRKWSLPMPAHALLTANPASDDIRTFSIEDHFYTDKMFFERGTVRLYFTPLTAYPLIRGQIRYTIFDNKVCTYLDDGRQIMSALSTDNRLVNNENSVWIGVAISEENLLSAESLTLCVLPENDQLTPFIKEIRAYDTDNHPIHSHFSHFSIPDKEKYHYFDDISDYYADNYITLDLAEHPNRESLCHTPLPRAWETNETDKGMERVCWFRLQFPSMLSHVDFGKIRILTNTFPVVNRQLISKRHVFSGQGNIISLPCEEYTHFLHVDSLQDNKGRNYENVQSHYEEHPSGAFSMYFGNLEKFDSDNARSLIIRLMRLLREDGSAFFSDNSEPLGSELYELYEKIGKLDKSAYDMVQKGARPRVFLLAYPKKDAEDVDVKYWISDGYAPNGLDERNQLFQLGIDKYQNVGLRFQTTTTQGTVHKDCQALIDSLRYGLLSGDRIVTQEDVRSYIYHKLGDMVKDIDIRDGVAISPDVRKGIVRTTEIKIRMKQRTENGYLDFPAIARFLEKELTKRSISSIPYKVSFE